MGQFVTDVNSEFAQEEVVVPTVTAAKFNPLNYLDTKLDKGVSKRQIVIRILPASVTNNKIFVAVKTHPLKVSKAIAQSGFKQFLCLGDNQNPLYKEGERCPLCARADELFNEANALKDQAKAKRAEAEEKNNDPALIAEATQLEANAKEKVKEAYTFKPKTTYIVRVIERGKEHEGVKFWRFNENSKKEGIYDELKNLYELRKNEKMRYLNVDNYNIFSVENGHDIVLTLERTVRADGQEGVSIKITDMTIDTPLSQSVEEGNAWIQDSKEWHHAYTPRDSYYLGIISKGLIPWYDRQSNTYLAYTQAQYNEKMAEIKNRKNGGYNQQQNMNTAPQQTVQPQMAQQPYTAPAQPHYQAAQPQGYVPNPAPQQVPSQGYQRPQQAVPYPNQNVIPQGYPAPQATQPQMPQRPANQTTDDSLPF